jgi:Fe-S cluster biosynthesis and repair protein YggX
MSERVVHCAKLGEDLPGLSKPPFKGEVGVLIFEKISEKAWNAWVNDMQIKVINEYRLNMGDPDDYTTLVEQMLLFLNLKSGEIVEVENSTRGRGN